MQRFFKIISDSLTNVNFPAPLPKYSKIRKIIRMLFAFQIFV